jgi:hypothetical protein
MSDVWNYFIKIGDKSKCKLCGKEVTRTDGSTSGKRRHLKSYHGESKKTGSSKEKIKVLFIIRDRQNEFSGTGTGSGSWKF